MENKQDSEDYSLRTIGDKRYPIPKDGVEQFMATVWGIAGMSGVIKIPSILKKIEELGDAVNDHITGRATGSNITGNDEQAHRKRFITIFKTRYINEYSHEYPNTFTGQDFRIIGTVIKKLHANGFGVDSYLKWIFDEHAANSKGFNPSSMKMVCCNETVCKFLQENKGCVDHNMLKMQFEERTRDLLMRAAAILRGDYLIPVEDLCLFKVECEKKKKGDITLDDIEKSIIAIEKKYGPNSGNVT
jgi:hypothetical protein